jgi:heme/copper-type cytochrome/quinol oxidase subunit 2
LPSVIVTLIALPSLSLVYTYDDLVSKPALTVKVTGRQWYWSYAMNEHVQMNLSQQAKDLLLNDSVLFYSFFSLFIFFFE